MSVRGAWQLPQLRFKRIEIDRLGQEIGAREFRRGGGARPRPAAMVFRVPLRSPASSIILCFKKCEQMGLLSP